MIEGGVRDRAHALLERLGPLAFDRDSEELILLALETLREHLGVEAVYLAEFIEREEVVHSAVGEPARFGLAPGVRIPYEESLSVHVLSGRVSNVIAHLAADPEVPDSLWSDRVGSFIATGVWGDRGQAVGMICAVDTAPLADVGPADVRFMDVVATLVATRLRASRERDRAQERLRRELRSLLEGGLDMAFQPIVDLRGGRVVGVEALARFPGDPGRSPQLWFTEAHRLGRGLDLEAAAIEAALDQRSRLPDGLYVSLNVSPALLLSGRVEPLLAQVHPGTVVLEMTEHISISDYEPLRGSLRPLRERGVRVAIDDAGAGFASFRHVLELRPDIIKLDVQLTRDLRHETPRRALAHALSAFASETEIDIVAEGVEHVAVVDELRRSGIRFAQGYLFARARSLPLRHLHYPIIIASTMGSELLLA